MITLTTYSVDVCDFIVSVTSLGQIPEWMVGEDTVVDSTFSGTFTRQEDESFVSCYFD